MTSEPSAERAGVPRDEASALYGYRDRVKAVLEPLMFPSTPMPHLCMRELLSWREHRVQLMGGTLDRGFGPE